MQLQQLKMYDYGFKLKEFEDMDKNYIDTMGGLLFLTENNFDGKKIVPFATNGGWLGHTFKDIKKICHDAEVEKELSVEYSENKMRTSMKEVEKWINTLK